MRLLSELVSRLSYRLGGKQLDTAFELAVSMYSSQLFHQDVFLHETAFTLLNRVLYAMSSESIVGKMRGILNLPIPGEGGISPRVSDWWKDPFQERHWLEDIRVDASFDTSDWRQPVAKLIFIAGHGDDQARPRAVWRLTALYLIGGLTSDEQADLANALWSRTDPDTGLPQETGMNVFSFLNLPETRPGMAKEYVRRYLLTGGLPGLGASSGAEGTKTDRAIGLGSGEDVPFRDWLHASVTPLRDSEQDIRTLIDWSPDDIDALLTKLRSWLESNKKRIVALKSESFPDITSLFARLGIVVNLMADVVLPRMVDASDSTKALARSMLTEFEDAGFNVLPALPGLLFLDPNLVDEVASRVRQGLSSVTEKEVGGAAQAMFNWMVFAQRKNVTGPPSDLITEVANRVRYRRQPGLTSLLRFTTAMIRWLDNPFTEDHLRALCDGLDYLKGETEVPTQDIPMTDIAQYGIPVAQRLSYRRLAAALAYQLFQYFESRDKEVLPALRTWREECLSTPLPELRRVWNPST